MTDKRNFYETLYLVRPDMGEDELSAIQGKLAAALKENEAETIRNEKWDERDLAYEVRGYRRGAYHILTYKALPGAPAALEKHLGFYKSDIMRFITVSVGEDQAHGREPEKPPAPPPVENEGRDGRGGHTREREGGGQRRSSGQRNGRASDEGSSPWKSARREKEGERK